MLWWENYCSLQVLLHLQLALRLEAGLVVQMSLDSPRRVYHTRSGSSAGRSPLSLVDLHLATPKKTPKKTPPRTPSRMKGTPRTPQTPKTPTPKQKTSQRRLPFSSIRSPMKEIQTPQTMITSLDLMRARECLHQGTPPSTLLGREDQLAKLTQFIDTHLADRTPGSMYISGPPGTGKTASLDLLLGVGGITGASVVRVNCMGVPTPQRIYRSVGEELGVDFRGCRGPTQVRDLVEERVTTGENMIVIVLDEIDQLAGGGQQVLYSLFEWPKLEGSRVILIGMANALDLTDRILPRLESHGFQPSFIHFPPYTHPQITAIITDRLARGGVGSAIQPMALSYCSKKVAAISGDIRAALDMCRAAVEMVEDLGTGVTIQLMNRVITDVSKPTSCEPLPLHQRIAACSLLLLAKPSGRKDSTLGKLYDAYVRVCERRKLVGVSEAEFVGVVDLLEVRGVVAVKRSKEPSRFWKVALRKDVDELRHDLQDNSLLSSCLEQGLP